MIDLGLPYLNVKVIVTSENQETTYEMTKVHNFATVVEYKQPPFSYTDMCKAIEVPKIERVAFYMRPLIDDNGVVTTVTTKTLGA